MLKVKIALLIFFSYLFSLTSFVPISWMQFSEKKITSFLPGCFCALAVAGGGVCACKVPMRLKMRHVAKANKGLFRFCISVFFSF